MTKTAEKKVTIGSVCMELIKAGLTNDAVVAAVKSKFPNAQTTTASVAWYRSKMNKTSNTTNAKAATKPQPKLSDTEVAKLIFEQLAQMLGSLQERWADEQEYEDFAEYVAAMTKRFNEACTKLKVTATFGRMTKRPFAFTFTVEKSEFKMSANSRGIKVEKTK